MKNMNTLQKLIDRCVNASNAVSKAHNDLDSFCEKNYNTTPSDIDADEILDGVMGYNGSCPGMSAKEFDNIMLKYSGEQ
jgi:hypothetical protein